MVFSATINLPPKFWLFTFCEKMPIKRAALLLTCGDTTDAAAASSIGMFRQICAYQQWEEAGIIVAPGLHNPDEIEGREELKQAKRLGEDI